MNTLLCPATRYAIIVRNCAVRAIVTRKHSIEVGSDELADSEGRASPSAHCVEEHTAGDANQRLLDTIDLTCPLFGDASSSGVGSVLPLSSHIPSGMWINVFLRSSVFSGAWSIRTCPTVGARCVGSQGQVIIRAARRPKFAVLWLSQATRAYAHKFTRRAGTPSRANRSHSFCDGGAALATATGNEDQKRSF